jgi:tRNA threonylcarbamoyladenosine biosynthesis protein TsaB
MLKILAADTSTMSGSVALLEGPEVVAEWTLRSSRTHNRRLLATIDRLLQEAGWDLEQLDAMAVTAGPGSFTGVRIGLSTVKSLAWSTGKRFLSIPTLDVLAAPLGIASHSVCALLDAKKHEVYCALYQPDGRGSCRLEGDYQVLSPERLADRIELPTLFCGDGWLLYRDRLRARLGELAIEAPDHFHVIRAGDLGILAFHRLVAGEAEDPMVAVPVYVRPSEAELKNPHLASA